MKNSLKNRLIHKPYKLIWVFAFIIALLTLFGLNSTLDISIHDTYYVFSNLGIFLTVYLFLIGLLYWLFRNKQLINWMITIIHLFATIFSFLILFTIGISTGVKNEIEIFKLFNQFSIILIAIIIFCQILFLLNLVISLFRNKK